MMLHHAILAERVDVLAEYEHVATLHMRPHRSSQLHDPRALGDA
jgi:hypothetical protein